MEVHVDASLHGLGAALVQDGKPVAYASKALTPTEQCYTNIKRELLAIVFGVGCFHNYVYGQTFTILIDHKPLEQIQQKTLADAPVHLQQMFICLQGYDCTISYCPVKEMLLADTLSRYAPAAAEEITLDTAIHHVHIGTPCKTSYQELTCTDPLLCTLAETIIASWPKDPKDVPMTCRISRTTVMS